MVKDLFDGVGEELFARATFFFKGRASCNYDVIHVITCK